MDLKEESLVDPATHWYYQAKLAALVWAKRRYCSHAASLVDVGAGSGFFALRLSNLDADVQVTCVDLNYPAEAVRESGAIRFVRFAEGIRADMYLFVDVLEHVPDDVEFLRSYTSGAQPGAVVLVTAPAFMSLWSSHDVFLDHYRRYRLRQLTDVVADAGLEVVHTRYLFGTIFPFVWIVRRFRRKRAPASDLRSAPRMLNGLLSAVLRAEHRILPNRLMGLTAFVVARVPSPDDAGSSERRTGRRERRLIRIPPK